MNNVLITGGAGFIGSNLSKSLMTKGYNITILDNLSPQIHGKDAKLPAFLKGKVRFIKGDVRNKDDWGEALKNQDAIIHLAAETGTGQSMYEIEKYVDVNIKGTALLLDYLTNQKHHIKKMIVASSRAIYGEGKYICSTHGAVYPSSRKPCDMEKEDFRIKCPLCDSVVNLVATDENSKASPTSIYGITKYNQEQMVLTIGKSLGIPSIALRYQNVYGPGQSLKNPYTGILSIFSTRIKKGRYINIFEDGKESRDFVYIDDVVSATTLALEDKKRYNEVYNVGTGIPLDVLTVTKKLIEEYNQDVEIKITGNYRLGDIRHNFADLTKIYNDLGFKPNVGFDVGIHNFACWVDSQDLIEDHYEKSLKELQKRNLFK